MSFLALSPAASVLCWCLAADIVVLKNGNEIQGEIIQETEDRVVLRFPGGLLELERRHVEEVRRQSRRLYLVLEGEKQLRREDHEDAVRTFREALREDPGSERAVRGLARAQEGLADALRDLGRYDEARALYLALASENPDHPRATAEVKAIDRTLEDSRMEEARGREEISSGDLEKGIWRLERIYDRFPDRRESLGGVLGEALVRRGDALLGSDDSEGAERHYERALLLDPELLPRLEEQYTIARQRRILPLLPEGDFEAAERLVEEGLEVHPTSEVLRYYRGLCLEARGEKRAAAEEYLAISDRKRPAELEDSVGKLRMEVEDRLAELGRVPRVANPRATEVLEGDFRELRTAHFSVLHKNPEVAGDVAFVAEQHYRRMLAELECPTHIRQPLQIVIFPSREEYLAASGQGSWSGGSHRVTRPMGALSDHRIFSYQGQPRLTSGILPHELAHALLVHRLNYPREIPLWANEGFAVTQEPSYFQRHYRRLVSRELARKTLLPVAELLEKDAYPEDQIHLFYAQSFSLVEFLISLEDLQTFLGFLKAVSQRGQDLELYLRRTYRIAGFPALENRWLAWFEREQG